MSDSTNVFFGGIGQGVWRSKDGGQNWEWTISSQMHIECEVRALAVHPEDPKVIYAGTNEGLYRTTDCGEEWHRLDSGMDDRQIWSLLFMPDDPNIILAGIRPAEVFRSTDGGESWASLNTGMAEITETMLGYNRVTTMVADPGLPGRVWASVEVDGVYRSNDWGSTWTHHIEGLTSWSTYKDTHSVAVVPSKGDDKKSLLVETDNNLHRSTDDGESFQPLNINRDFPGTYCRGIKQQPGRPEVLFLGNGSGTNDAYNISGAAWRSQDSGKSWQRMPLPVEPFSTVWDFAVHSADPNRVFAYTIFGEIFDSKDGGDSWEKLPRTFGEIRAMAWTPG